MLAEIALAVALKDCVPMRWISGKPESLGLLQGTPINCLLLEEENWSLGPEAKKQRLVTLGVARSADQAERAMKAPLDGVVVEGEFEWTQRDTRPVIALPPRRGIHFDSISPVTGTNQGVWPGIEIEHGGKGAVSSAAPTGQAWINTNTGFLRFARSATSAAFWMGNRPPAGTLQTSTRYAAAIADAAAVGARWVISLDDTLSQRMLARDSTALNEWKRIAAHIQFYEQHPEWRRWRPRAELAIIQDPESGALVTGNLLDMLAVMNTPVRAVPSRALDSAKLDGTKVTVTVDPRSYTEAQRDLIAKFASHGGKVVSGPEGWAMPTATGDQITFNKQQYKQLEAIWPELHMAVQRKNFGARLFNVTGTLSYLQASPDGKRILLQLVNYTDYPVESITAFVQGKFQKATLLTPEAAPRNLTIYDAPEGTAVEIDRLGVCGAVILE